MTLVLEHSEAEPTVQREVCEFLFRPTVEPTVSLGGRQFRKRDGDNLAIRERGFTGDEVHWKRQARLAFTASQIEKPVGFAGGKFGSDIGADVLGDVAPLERRHRKRKPLPDEEAGA